MRRCAFFIVFCLPRKHLWRGCTSVEMHSSWDAPLIVSTFVIPKGLRRFLIR